MKAPILGTTVALLAAVLAAPAVATDWAADDTDIRRQINESVVAFNRGDLPGHLAIYDENVTFMTKDGPRPGSRCTG